MRKSKIKVVKCPKCKQSMEYNIVERTTTESVGLFGRKAITSKPVVQYHCKKCGRVAEKDL